MTLTNSYKPDELTFNFDVVRNILIVSLLVMVLGKEENSADRVNLHMVTRSPGALAMRWVKCSASEGSISLPVMPWNTTHLERESSMKKEITYITDEVSTWKGDGAYYIKRKYVHLSRCPMPANWSKYATWRGTYTLYLVYFVNCKIHDGYGEWMLAMVKSVPADATLEIVATSRSCKAEAMLYQNYETIATTRSGVTLLECHDEGEIETFEYHGIRKAWEIGQLSPERETVIGYFHSKGLTHARTYKDWLNLKGKDWKIPKTLDKEVMSKTDRVFESFDLFPWIDKAGATSGGNGWIWWNFWFARGSYLQEVPEPIITSRRLYYEDWLGRFSLKSSRNAHPSMRSENRTGRPNVIFSCYSLAGVANMGYFFNPNTRLFYPY